MKLLLFRSLWTNGFNLEAALADCCDGEFDGVEGPLPAGEHEQRRFIERVRGAGVPCIVEIATGGGYVPAPHLSVEEHVKSFRLQAEAAVALSPLFLTVLGGNDAWPIGTSVLFFQAAMRLASDLGVAVCFETHRSRSTFSPWATRDLLQALPDLRLTCDFSHWCCVCERLVLDDEPELLRLVGERADHIHARVGYEQGPQVPHPAAPEYARQVEAHEQWWATLLKARQSRGESVVTMTPEFGPDGYLQSAPFTQEAATSLDEVNAWMAKRLRQRFGQSAFAAEIFVNPTA